MRRAIGLAALTLALLACAPANERPLHGALPGSQAPADADQLPPTLAPSDGLQPGVPPSPSPGLPESSPVAAMPSPAAAPSPAVAAAASPVATAAPAPAAASSPVAAAAPPIVRSISPSRGGHVASGGPVTISALLVGRSADLASAALSLNGSEATAQIDKRSAREWSIHISRVLAAGSYTAHVAVRDASGASGGFTWQFDVGGATVVGP